MKAWYLRGRVKVGNYTQSQPVLHSVTHQFLTHTHTHTDSQKQTADSGTHSWGKYHQHYTTSILLKQNTSTISILKLKRARGSAPYKWTTQGLQGQNLKEVITAHRYVIYAASLIQCCFGTRKASLATKSAQGHWNQQGHTQLTSADV